METSDSPDSSIVLQQVSYATAYISKLLVEEGYLR